MIIKVKKDKNSYQYKMNATIEWESFTESQIREFASRGIVIAAQAKLRERSERELYALEESREGIKIDSDLLAPKERKQVDPVTAVEKSLDRLTPEQKQALLALLSQ